MKVYFVRHGETDANQKHLEQNREGVLTDLGKKQAEFVGKRFSSIPIDSIICSPYPRTKETAKIINQNLNKDIQFFKIYLLSMLYPQYLKVKI